jgi:hypothetical protein
MSIDVIDIKRTPVGSTDRSVAFADDRARTGRRDGHLRRMLELVSDEDALRAQRVRGLTPLEQLILTRG